MDHPQQHRPPSSRPGTRHQQNRPGTAASSAAQLRRPKTAGRNSERPPSGQIPISSSQEASSAPPPPPSYQPPISGAVPRPQSRIGLANDMIGSPAEYRPGTRVGIGSRMGTASGIVPASAAGSRAVSRRGLQSSMGGGGAGGVGIRPGTMSRVGQFPPGTASRPITQQGVSGARTSALMGGSRMGSRMGTAMGGRMVTDKSYYVGLLNNQLNTLEGELANLESELEKAEKGRENLLAYEQRAEEQAQELKRLQGQLTDYNFIIDRQNSNTNLRSLEAEVDQAVAANQDLTNEVEDLFRERRVREEEVHELEERIDRLRAQNAEKMGSMEHELKEEFEQVSTEAETLRTELEQKQAELDVIVKQKEEMDLALANSPQKQQAMVLEEQLRELADKREAIQAELQSEQTPEAQREHFAQKIQKDNEEIGHMQTQLQEMNERMGQAQEELQEFQNEFELLAGDKSDRFRELKTREAHMDTFLDSFDETKTQIGGRIGALAQQIVRELQLISLNCRHGELATNVTGLDESLLALGSAGVSANELQELHVRLQEELITLGQREALLRTELASIRSKQVEIDAAHGQMGDMESRKAELRNQQRELVVRRNGLEEELGRLEAENERLRAQTQEEEQRLGSNLQLQRLKDLKTRMDALEKERRTLDEKLKSQQAKYDYEPLKQRALELRAEYNEFLIQLVLGRQQKTSMAH